MNERTDHSDLFIHLPDAQNIKTIQRRNFFVFAADTIAIVLVAVGGSIVLK